MRLKITFPLTTLLIWCVFGHLAAQQAPQYSLYWLNPYSSNPAYAGLDNTLVATGVYRQQWSGLQGAPVTQHINAHLPVYRISSGVGLKVENDVIGAHRTTQAMLSYSYQLPLGREAVLSFGVSGGYLQYALDGAKLRAPEGTYAEPGTSGGIFSHNDPQLPEGKMQAGTPVGEVGIFLQTPKLEVGAAVQPVFAPIIRATSKSDFALVPVRQYLAYGTYKISVGENLEVRPAFLLKSDITETQTEISAALRWRENTFAGLSYRGFSTSSRDAAVLFGGFKLNERTTLAYAFDIPLSSLQAANRGSHELLLRYSLNKPIGTGKLPPIIYNPRFF